MSYPGFYKIPCQEDPRLTLSFYPYFPGTTIIHSHTQLRNVMASIGPGPLLPGLQPAPLIQGGRLKKMAGEKKENKKGYNGEERMHFPGGNTFYVNAILASYILVREYLIISGTRSYPIYRRPGSPGSYGKYYRHAYRHRGQIIEKMEPAYAVRMKNVSPGNLLGFPRNGLIFLKHELYRRTIETSFVTVRQGLL